MGRSRAGTLVFGFSITPRGRLVASALAGVLSTPALAAADVLLDGVEFQVNTYTTGDQEARPARVVARAPDGSFVVVWTSEGQDGSGESVHGQRFDASGAAVGTEFQVNTHTTSDQNGPAVSAAADGSFVVVWGSYGQDGGGFSVHGQRYDSAGAAAGTEFQLNTHTTNAQRNPSVSTADDGSFVVVWVSNLQDGSNHSVQGRRYDSSGAAIGTEFQVNTHTTLNQNSPAVSTADDGSFVVVWMSDDAQDGSGRSVHGQRYDSAGAPVGTEFEINTFTTFNQGFPVVSASGDGSFVVVWDSNGQDGSGYGVHGQRYDSTGAAVGTEFQVNTHTTSDQNNAAVSAADDGSFLVVWDSVGQDGSSGSVHGQRYDSAGASVGTEFQVNTYTTSNQGFSNSVAVDASGDFVVVWQSFFQDGSGYGMFGQRFCADVDSNAVCDSAQVGGECGMIPAIGCMTGAKSSLSIKDNADDNKDQLKWKLSMGDTLDHMMLGDPVTARTYALCIYDESASAPNLITTLEIAPSTLWVSKDPKGFDYKDKSGVEAGVTKVKLKTGAAGKSQAQVQAKGMNIPMPTPFSMTEIFDQDTKVIVQLVNDETSTCWTSEFTTNTKNDGVQFKAKAP